MNNYKIAKEKAEEWSVTSQYIQSLCRQGKINGAIKRAGIWFIPDDAPNPTKNTKPDAKPFQFVGTKKEIFEKSIELFASHGFETVPVKDIAKAVGIQQSAVYNHFKSKQEILDTIYDFYSYYYISGRPSLEELDPILENGSLYDIFAFTCYEFDKDIQQNMLDATKIIFQLKFVDEHARKLVKMLTIDEGINFVEAVFKRAVEKGRLAPHDIHAVSVFVNSAALFTLHSWIIDPSPENAINVGVEEHALFQYATQLLTDLRPSAEN